MFATVKDLTQNILVELGLIDGTAVQKYEEPELLITLNRTFDFLFEKRFWPHLTYATNHELDGVTGVVTSDIIRVNKLEDIQSIRLVGGLQTPFNFISNENDDDFLQGNHHESFTHLPYDHPHFNGRIFQVIPQTTVGTVRVNARRHPGKFVEIDDTLIPMDETLFHHAMCFFILAKDGMNSTSQSVHETMYIQRYQDIISANSHRPQHFGGSSYATSFTVAEE